MKFSLLLAISLLGLRLVAQTAEALRFSVSLKSDERSASGFNRLTSDQIAVIDALVRRDTGARTSAPSEPNAGSANSNRTFSQRLTTQERGTAGLISLSPSEVAQLDAYVDRQQNATLARTLLAPPVFLARRTNLTPTERKTEREIHGAFSLSYGLGSGGYSEKTGSMLLTMEDPARRFSISFGYTESHVKGGHGYYREPFYEPSRPLYPDDPLRP